MYCNKSTDLAFFLLTEDDTVSPSEFVLLAVNDLDATISVLSSVSWPYVTFLVLVSCLVASRFCTDCTTEVLFFEFVPRVAFDCFLVT